jgi:fucose permease
MSQAHVHGSASQVRHAVWATRGMFCALGILGGAWGVHIPSVKDHYGLEPAALSIVLVAAAIGAVASMLFAGRVIGRVGTRNATTLCALVMAAMLGLVLHWPSYEVLLATMLVFGAAMSMYDVAINTEGSALETAGGRPIMGSLHGMFSVGAMVGAALMAVLLRLQVTASVQLAAVGVVVAASVLVGSRWMLPIETDTPKVDEGAHFTWPHGALLVIGLLIFTGMSAEGAMYDWCVLYLKQEVRMPQDQAALGYAAFAGAMAVMRFTADGFRHRFSDRLLLRVSGVLTAVSMAVVLLCALPWVSLVGFALAGAGLAMVVPILYGAAARVPGTTPAAAIAAVSAIGYSGFMVGPPVIGAIAQYVSLTAAMLVVVVGAAALGAFAHHVPDRKP